MAVDSAAKRASAHRAASWPGRVLPIPDSTIAASDRAHLAGFYGGLFGIAEVDLKPPFKARFTQPNRKAVWLRSD